MKRTASTTLALATAALLAAATLGAAPVDPAQARVPGPVTGLDPAQVGWYSYRDQTSAAFAATFDRLEADYLPVDLEIDTEGGYRVGSVWQRNTEHRAWREKRDLSFDGFHAYWTQAKADGYRLVEQETYLVGSTRRWAGVWLRNPEGLAWASKRGQTSAQLATTEAAYRQAGLMPVDVDEYLVSGSPRWNTVWVASQGRAWQLVRDRTSAQWASSFAALSGGYRLLSFESVQTPSGQRYAVAFVANSDGPRWAEVRDMTATTYANRWYRYRDLGYRLVGFDSYQTASGTRYAGIWRQNSERPDWSHRAAFDSLVQDELNGPTKPASDTSVDPHYAGVSVAVYDHGVPVYTRGFGMANKAGGVWMDATHVGNLASVSKAVAGVLTLRMVEDGLVTLADKTRRWVPSMPAKHTHTLGQLLSNRGCVRHYPSTGGEDFDGEHYATALAASREFWDDALVCDPATTVMWKYSTHGYTLLGAALEAAGRDDVQDLVRKRLTTPYSLGTLGPQVYTGHRFTPYDKSQQAVAVPVNDWKVLGGGLDSDAVDLAGFGDKLLRGEILTRTSLDAMWTRPDTTQSYGYGWLLGSIEGNRYAAKDGAGTGVRTYLLVFRDLGLSIAVMANARNQDVKYAGDESYYESIATRLATTLGAELVSWPVD